VADAAGFHVDVRDLNAAADAKNVLRAEQIAVEPRAVVRRAAGEVAADPGEALIVGVAGGVLEGDQRPFTKEVRRLGLGGRSVDAQQCHTGDHADNHELT
jgi:hypothetical protein